jgi:hypothetical protein
LGGLFQPLHGRSPTDTRTSSCCELARREGMKPPKQPKTPIAGAKHEGAANVRAGVRSAATSKKPRHENDGQEAGPNQAGGEEGRGRPAAKPEPSDAEREAISRATVRLSERPRRVALRTETIKGKLAEIGPSHSDHLGWLAPGRCRMHGGASPDAPEVRPTATTATVTPGGKPSKSAGLFAPSFGKRGNWPPPLADQRVPAAAPSSGSESQQGGAAFARTAAASRKLGGRASAVRRCRSAHWP